MWTERVRQVGFPIVHNNSEHHVDNSTNFAKLITTQTIEEGGVLVMLDVVFIFTKIPTNVAI